MSEPPARVAASAAARPRVAGPRAWLLCVAAAAGAMALRAALSPLLPADELPFVFAFPAVAFVALRAGVPHGFLAVLICAAWVIAPVPPVVDDSNGALQVGLFVSSACVLALLVGAPRRDGPDGARTDGEGLRELLFAGDRSPLVRWLTAAFVAAAIVPAVLFAGIAAYAWRQAFESARRDLERTVVLAHDYTASSLGTARDIFARVHEYVDGRDTAALRADEAALHGRLRDLATGKRYVESVWILAVDGSLVASNQFHPSPRGLDSSEREYFRAHRAGYAGEYVSKRLESRFDGRALFSLSVPRASAGAPFDGVFAIGIGLRWFDAFFESLARDAPELAIGLVREDGEVLTRRPASDAPMSLPAGSPILVALAEGAGPGRPSRSVWPDGEERLGAFRRIEGLPLSVFATLPTDVVLARWSRSVATTALFTFPIALSLIYVSGVALRRTRREQRAVRELAETEAQRARAERALQEAQKLEALGRLTGGVAHDFNNLMTTFNNSAHVLRRLELPPLARTQVDAVLRAVGSGRQLTRQLLTIARRQPLRPEAVDLARRLGPICDLVRLSIDAGVRVEHRVEPGTPNVVVDVPGLQLAILNLALNARDAMPGGGRLSVVASVAEPDPSDAAGARRVALAVSDTGCGMAPEVRARALEPFFSTKGALGTGLGLSQVYGFCTQSGGTLRIDSVPGRGTTVTLVLPATDEPDRGTAETVDDGPAGSGTVLYVEDDPEVARSTHGLLRSLGYGCEHAPGPERAIERLRAAPDAYVAVLSDIGLPGAFDGIELGIRLRDTYPALPIVLTTGYTDRLAEAVARGFTVLAKPCEPHELGAAIRQAAGRRPA